MDIDKLNEKAQRAGYADAHEHAEALISQQYPATPADRVKGLARECVRDAIRQNDVLERVI